MRKFVLFAMSAVIVLATGAAQTWKADVAHSNVKFTVTHLMISEVSGRFSQFDATLRQGKEDFSDSKVEATIKVASINTDNEGRDKHLRSDDFFNAEKFPDITFVSTSFEKTGNGTYKIAGRLTIRDVTRDVVLDAKQLGTITDVRGGLRVGFKATTSINRMDYNVKWNKSLDAGGVVVSDNVDITLAFEFVKQN